MKNYTDEFLKLTSLFLGELCIKLYNKWKTVLFIFTIITIGLGIGLRSFKLDQSMEAFFKKDNKTLKTYQWFKYTFGSDESVLVMYTPSNGDVFSTTSLENLKKIEDELNKEKNNPNSPLNRIKRVRSLISSDYLENREDTLISRPFIGNLLPKNKDESNLLRELARKNKNLSETFFSKDSKFALILIETDYGSRLKEDSNLIKNSQIENEDFDFGEDMEEEDTNSRIISIAETPELEEVPMDGYSDFVSALKKVFASFHWKQKNTSYFAGNPWLIDFFLEIIMIEMEVYSILSFIIIWIVMTITYRSFSALVWPTFILASGAIWCLGLSGWVGTKMTFMVNIIIFLLLAVSIASSIHILTGYSRNLDKLKDKKESIRATYLEVGVPIILASITTGIGLLSLIFVPILAIQIFGIYASIGVFFTLLINIFMWPIFIRIWSPKLIKTRKREQLIIHRFLHTQYQRVCSHRGLIITIFALVTIFGVSGLFKVEIDTNLVKMIKSGYGITESYGVIDKYFGGTASIEVLINTGKQDGAKDHKLLVAIDNFTSDIKSRHPNLVKRSNSIVDITKDSHKNLTDGSKKNYTIPNSTEKVIQVLTSFESADPATRKLIIDNNWQVIRVTFSLITTGSKLYETFLNDMKIRSKIHFSDFLANDPNFKIIYTGGIQLMTEMISLVSISMIQSFSLALGVICIALFLVFGSIKFGLLSMIPNIFPIILTMGVAGWFGIPMDSDTLLVMPIAIGIAVDDTIHLLTHYKSELLNGKSNKEAIENSIQKVGTAIISTTSVLSLGFLIFIFSSYLPLTYFGVLSSLAITSALFADLFLVPILLDTLKPFNERGV